MNIKKTLKQLARLLFEVAQRFKIDILPHHFYSQIPDIAYLKTTTNWLEPRTLVDVLGKEIEDQIEFLDSCEPLKHQTVHQSIYEKAIEKNGAAGFGYVESIVLFAFIHRYRPKHVIQIGCGVSTAVILAANEGNPNTKVICIDPFPTDYLVELADKDEIELIIKPAQELDVAVFDTLDEGDLLFIDSTHTVKPGSEVNFLIHEVLQRIKQNVFVHFHDIYFPFDYTRDVLTRDLFFPLESSLLHAFLTGNSSYRIAMSLSMLHYDGQHAIQKQVPTYEPDTSDNYGLSNGDASHFPSSLYIEKI